MRKLNGMLRAFISLWCWIAIMLSSFLMFVLAVVGKTVSRPAAIVFAIVIFALSLVVPIVNPGIFVKRHTTATGGCGD